jgi:hypothetical protein
MVKDLLPLLTRSGGIQIAYTLLVAQSLLTQERSKSRDLSPFKTGAG